MATQPEAKVQKEILNYLRELGLFVWTNKNQGTYDPKIRRFRKTNQLKGVSDILGLLPDGRFLAIEVKYGSNKPTLEQFFFLGKVNDKGGLAFTAWSVEDVKENLSSGGYRLMFEQPSLVHS